MKAHLTGILGCAVVVACIAFPSRVLALTMEYVTYNGFDPVVMAFEKIALIFSDGGYKGLFAAVIVLGMLLGGAGAMVRAATGAKASPLSWGIPVMVGIALYAGLVVPKGTIVVYDETLNKSRTIADVPDGLVLVAGMLNKLERGLVDIVSTAGEPASYHLQAGGIGFDMLLNIEYQGALFSDQFLHASLNNYTKDCVFFELMRPGTTLTVNSLASNADALGEYAKAGNMAIYTVIHTEADTRGTTYTCREAWQMLSAQLANASNYDKISQARCADAGFDPTNPTELNRCREILSNTINYIHNAAYSPILYYQQKIVADSLLQTLSSTSPDMAAALFGSQSKGNAAMSAGIMFGKWLPAIRGVMTAIAIGMIPFFVLFLPTPYWKQALGITAGFFVWLTAWGVTDAVIHGFAIDYGRKVTTEVAQYQLGYLSFLNFQAAGQKTMAMFAMVRSAGLMLATVITGTLIRFGGHALSSLSGQLSSAVTHGQTPGLDLASKGQAEGSLVSGASNFASAEGQFGNSAMFGHPNHGYGFRSRVEASMARQVSQARGFEQLKSSFGADGAIDAMAGTHVGRAIQGAAAQSLVKSIGAGAMTAMATADQNALATAAQRHGMSPAGLKNLMATGSFEKQASVIRTFRELSGAATDGEAAIKMGAATGVAAGAQGVVTQNIVDTLGAGGIVETGTVGELNLAANRMMMFERLQHLGYAGSTKDFQGILEGRKAANGTETFMLSNQSAVDRLNAGMAAQGYGTRFKIGDQVQLGMSGGRITLAKATRGASRDALDISKSLTGREDVYKNISKSETGREDIYKDITKRETGWENIDKGINRGEYGSSTHTYNENVGHGLTTVMVEDPLHPGQQKPMQVAGIWQMDDKGKVVSGQYSNTQAHDVIMLQSLQDKKGNRTMAWTKGKLSIGPDGQHKFHDFTALETQTSVENGYVTQKIKDPTTGQAHMARHERGVDVQDLDRYTMDLSKRAKITGGTLLTLGTAADELSDRQKAAIYGAEAVDTGMRIVGNGLKVFQMGRDGGAALRDLTGKTARDAAAKTEQEGLKQSANRSAKRQEMEQRQLDRAGGAHARQQTYTNPNNPDFQPPGGAAPSAMQAPGPVAQARKVTYSLSPAEAATRDYLASQSLGEEPSGPVGGGAETETYDGGIADADMSKKGAGRPKK